ncbi:hypothetical protein CUMW_161690 [Citrus unshiu]|uniref:Uncharacterized protein n=1 Tax=Citrus unshiu TaxID=55188 RepID=A0A2H5PRT5_CITUN|nr:hypothetical protein CUMW_161690 [Citrus unshiu]
MKAHLTCIAMASQIASDLQIWGCSSGPNVFLPTWQAIEVQDTICSRLKHKPPILHAFTTVPTELVSERRIPLLNKRDVCLAKIYNPPSVPKVFLDQFEKLKTGGRMVLNFLGNDKYHTGIFELLGMVLNDMVSEGLIEESKLESFRLEFENNAEPTLNYPVYTPCVEEVRQVMGSKGSFNIHQHETSHISWSAGYENDNKGLELNKHARAKNVANNIK